VDPRAANDFPYLEEDNLRGGFEKHNKNNKI
jgi:hypothetical protein